MRNADLRRAALAALFLALAACGQTTPSGETPAASAPSEEQPAPSASAAEETQYCSEVGRRLSEQDCADLGRLADEAAAGTAAFNAPDPMQRGEVHTLQLAVSLEPPQPAAAETPAGENAEQLARELEEARFRAEHARRESVQADSRRMEVARLEAQVRAWDVENTRLQQEIDNASSSAPLSAVRLAEIRARQNDLQNSITAARNRIETLTAEAASQAQTDPAPPPPAPSAPRPTDVVDPLSGETVAFTPIVGRFMRAELVGNGFDITPLTSASQEVLPDSVTTWSWRVVANEGGRRSLTLRTVVEGCTADRQCYPLRSTSQNYEVEVTVGLLGQAQDLLTAAPVWLRLLAGVLAALAVLVGAWFGLRNAFRKGRAS